MFKIMHILGFCVKLHIENQTKLEKWTG